MEYEHRDNENKASALPTEPEDAAMSVWSDLFRPAMGLG
jgi:hypothetical protein